MRAVASESVPAVHTFRFRVRTAFFVCVGVAALSLRDPHAIRCHRLSTSDEGEVMVCGRRGGIRVVVMVSRVVW